MSRYRCQYRGAWFDSDSPDVTADRCIAAATPGEDLEQPKPARVPGALDPYRNADAPGTEWQPEPIAQPAPVKPKPFLDQLADIMDAIPAAPGFARVPARECAWCRVTKKIAPWVGFVVVGLLVAWLSRTLFRR